ncbi:MAG: hypothetical protein GY854_07835 [Deltaproteobacteria bacterium]|nr:hypothetical protein [Deltaproteobacteria bacterium]
MFRAKGKLDVTGNHNVAAGRDVNVFAEQKDDLPAGFRQMFRSADAFFRSRISQSGIILRKNDEIKYSSQELFTSLMQIGIPFEASINIPFQMLPQLEEIADANEDEYLSTSDIRVAVVQCINGLAYEEQYSEGQTAMWSTAYIRRYGNPNNQFVMVIDRGEEKALNYGYMKEIILPHVVRRIIGLQKYQDPISIYRSVLSSKMVNSMVREILHTVNTLNLYCIRYKALLYLLEDLILEPPHPWFVNCDTATKVVSYNCERASYHLDQMTRSFANSNAALFNYSSRECFMHLCAIVLSEYGSFLGVGSGYGLKELKRMLRIREGNPALWDYCRIGEIEDALSTIGSSTIILSRNLDNIRHHLETHDSAAKFESLMAAASQLLQLVVSMFPELRETELKRHVQE